MDTEDYKDENIICAFLSDASADECEQLLGKTIAKVEAREYTFILFFTDGSTLELNGNRWGGCALGIEFSEAG